MPAILPDDTHESWLRPNTKKDVLTSYLKDYPSNMMAYHQVSKSVNKATNDDPSLIQPII
jgi:putative SOS response-associated peptidase YedK